MITLNTLKGLVRFESWDDIFERPGFKESLNPQDHELQEILGHYVVKDKVKCGLSNCRTPHGKGYIVSTKTGQETNIGSVCGHKHFGVDFDMAARDLDRAIAEKENRELLWSAFFNIEETEEKVAALRQGANGADWVHRYGHNLVEANAQVPLEIVRRVAGMVKSRNNILTISRQATQEEVAELEVRKRHKVEWPHYIDEPIAEIVGLEALYPENNLRQLLVLDLAENIRAFKALTIDSLSFEKLSFWKRWVTSIDRTVENASRAVEAGRLLLTVENLSPLLRILEERDQREIFRAYLDGLKRKQS